MPVTALRCACTVLLRLCISDALLCQMRTILYDSIIIVQTVEFDELAQGCRNFFLSDKKIVVSLQTEKQGRIIVLIFANCWKTNIRKGARVVEEARLESE